MVYQIISMENENAADRYGISILAQEEIAGTQYFWVEVSIAEEILVHGYNTIDRQLKKNISFRALLPPKGVDVFAQNPADFISGGIFPGKALELLVQIGGGPWHEVDPKDFFGHQDVIEDTPYALTPHARAKIDFSKLAIDDTVEEVKVPAGTFSCHKISVATAENEDYRQEGFELWASSAVPILGMVKMEFSKTSYWEKFAYKRKLAQKSGAAPVDEFFKQRVPGRMRPDTCTVLLIDYGTR